MSKFSYVITVDENDVHIEKRPIGTLRFDIHCTDRGVANFGAPAFGVFGVIMEQME